MKLPKSMVFSYDSERDLYTVTTHWVHRGEPVMQGESKQVEVEELPCGKDKWLAKRWALREWENMKEEYQTEFSFIDLVDLQSHVPAGVEV